MTTRCVRQGQIEVGIIEHRGREFSALGATVVGRHVTGHPSYWKHLGSLNEMIRNGRHDKTIHCRSWIGRHGIEFSSFLDRRSTGFTR
jgi:hypothetical protein